MNTDTIKLFSKRDFNKKLKNISLCTKTGRVISITGNTARIKIGEIKIGDEVEIGERKNIEDSTLESTRGIVTSFEDSTAVVTLLGDKEGLKINDIVHIRDNNKTKVILKNYRGNIYNSLGQEVYSKINYPIQTKEIEVSKQYSIPHPLTRSQINEKLETGIASIDRLLTLGVGQRICVFAEPGTGKTTLLQNLAKTKNTTYNIIVLVGERGREVQEFIDHRLSPERLEKTTIFYSTSDETPYLRINSLNLALSMAEQLRAKGEDVLLLVDSLTRILRAARDVGLSNGELPIRAGYPLSVYSLLPKIFEHGGKIRLADSEKAGSITSIFTALINNPDNESIDDPFIEEIKGVSDGHIYLSRDIANQGVYPAIDHLKSLSRLQNDLISPNEKELVKKFRESLQRVKEEKSLSVLSGNKSNELLKAESLLEKINNKIIKN